MMVRLIVQVSISVFHSVNGDSTVVVFLSRQHVQERKTVILLFLASELDGLPEAV